MGSVFKTTQTFRFFTAIKIFTLMLMASSTAFAKLHEVQTIEGITEYQMKNGLQVLLFPDESKDTITVNITYRVGSKHENYGETGMAHLLEHLLFKGSKKHKDISKELTDHGAKANGTTWLERTNYYETFKATDENLDWALSMEADRMVNSFVAKKDLDSEMTVVRNEFERGENLPWRILLQRIYSSAFVWHNYGNSTIGARSDIENVKIENLRAFYKRYYQPDNATLIVAGKIDKARTLKLIKKYFGRIKKPKRVLPEFYTKDPEQDGERSITLRRSGGEQALAAAYHIPSGTHEDFPAIQVLASILGNPSTGRLYKNLVETKLATGTWAWPNQQKEASLLYFNASMDLNTDANATRESFLNTLEGVEKTPITEEELERAKRKLLKNIELSFNDSQRISIGLSEWIGIGDWRLLFVHRDRLENVTLEDVQRVANYYLISSNRTLGQFIPTDEPQRAEITDAPELASLVDGYQGRKTIAQGEVFDATLENIAEREIRVQKNGIKISMVPIKTRGESVFIEMRMGLGNEKSLESQGYALEFLSTMLTRGTEKYTRQSLQDEFDKIKASGGTSSDQQAVYATYETTRENLPKVIALMHEYLTTASFPEKEFDLIKSQKLAKLDADSTDPQRLAFSGIVSALNTYNKGSIHYAPSMEEQEKGYKELSLAQVKNLYTSHFGASDLQFGIVGDFDHKEISDQIIKHFSGWKSTTKYKRSLVEFQKVEPTTRVIETPDKKNSIFVAGKNLDMNHLHPDAPALYVVTRMLGGGFLNSRLASRIRQKDGLSYGVRAMVRMSKREGNARFYAYAISAPQNTEKVQQAFNEEMERAIKEGFTEEELRSSIDGLLDEAKVNRTNNGRLVSTMRSFYHDDYTLLEEKVIQDNLRELTVEDVNRVMKTYLDPKSMTIFKAGDFANVK